MTQDELVDHYAVQIQAILTGRFGGLRLSEEPGEGLVTPEEVQEVTRPIVKKLHDALDRLFGPIELTVTMDKETREIYVECAPDIAGRFRELQGKVRIAGLHKKGAGW